MSTDQTKVIGTRAEQAILERVAAALENEMPMLRVEVVLTETYSRIHRISHPTYLDKPVYLRVTAHAIDADEASKMFPDSPPWHDMRTTEEIKTEARAKTDPGMVELLDQREEEESLRRKALEEEVEVAEEAKSPQDPSSAWANPPTP